MVLIISGCSVKKTEELKENIKDKSIINYEENYKGNNSGSYDIFNGFAIDTSNSEEVVIVYTDIIKTNDSIGNATTIIKQTEIKKTRNIKGINQSLNTAKLQFKQDSSSSTRTNIKNDIDKSTKTKETASYSFEWFNLLWLLVPLGMFIYLRYFRE
jgi:hypothetical protein